MKECPTCGETYKDDNLNYCLADGSTLLKKRTVVKRHSFVNEIVAFVMLGLAVLIFLCLVSYSPTDPTFNTVSSQATKNWIGRFGANVSEFLMSVAGIVAYLFPVLIAIISWRIFQSEDLTPRIGRIIGFVLFILSASGIATLIGWHGGVVGGASAAVSVYLLSTLGSAILLGILLVVSILLITDLTFLGMFSSFEMARENFKIHYAEWKEKRGETPSSYGTTVSQRKAKRSEKRSKQPFEEPPTASLPATIFTSMLTAGAGLKTAFSSVFGGTTTLDPAEPVIKTQPSISTKKEKLLEVDEPEMLPDEPQDHPEPVIVPQRKFTGELETADDDIDESEIDVPITSSANGYEGYVLPSPEYLTPPEPHIEHKEDELRGLADRLVEKTREFNVGGRVMNIMPGPVVTTYEFKPDSGVKYSRVTGLVDDLCLALQAESIRIDRIPGKAYVGIEVPNRHREVIQLRQVIDSPKFKNSESHLTLALGQTIDGANYVADLAKMPHLLIAGQTGAGKSVGVNTLVVSILYKARPDEVKFIMVDPKRLELGLYADIPHLATPIITDPKRAAISLRWAVAEMERRYKDLAGYGVRNIDGYNVEARRRNELEMWDDNGEPHRILPYIVIIIDELADLMMVSGKEVEESITRLAQMARAVGIHLVLATQRPSVDVITGLIKANFPTRISFRVSSKVDSRTIIDSNGAEGLLGKGDMLFLPPASSQLVRVHGAYVDEKEIARVVDHIKKYGRPEYDTTITQSDEEVSGGGELPGFSDPLFNDAMKAVVAAKKASTSHLQRHLRIGYGRAAAILDAMFSEGYIGEMDGSSRGRPVTQKAIDFVQDLAEMNDGEV